MKFTLWLMMVMVMVLVMTSFVEAKKKTIESDFEFVNEVSDFHYT